eukprot:15432314-Alexandrium_andersonii.AAC.1
MRARFPPESPEGDTRLPSVAPANLMASRCALSAALADAMNLTWATERPSSTILIFHKRMQWLAGISK